MRMLKWSSVIINTLSTKTFYRTFIVRNKAYIVNPWSHVNALSSSAMNTEPPMIHCRKETQGCCDTRRQALASFADLLGNGFEFIVDGLLD